MSLIDLIFPTSKKESEADDDAWDSDAPSVALRRPHDVTKLHRSIVLYYLVDCPHCRDFWPTWIQLVGRVTNPDVVCTHVECSEAKEAAAELMEEARTFPALGVVYDTEVLFTTAENVSEMSVEECENELARLLTVLMNRGTPGDVLEEIENHDENEVDESHEHDLEDHDEGIVQHDDDAEEYDDRHEHEASHHDEESHEEASHHDEESHEEASHHDDEDEDDEYDIPSLPVEEEEEEEDDVKPSSCGNTASATDGPTHNDHGLLNSEHVAPDALDGHLQNAHKDMRYVVLYYATWCGHCREMKGAWNNAVEKGAAHPLLKDYVKWLTCCCDEGAGKRTAQQHGIQGFPTIRIHHEYMEDYDGPRDAKSIWKHVRRPEL